MTIYLAILLAMRKVDVAHVTPREVAMLEGIRQNPGISGLNLSRVINVRSRSNIQGQMRKLIDEGYIVDKRVRKGLHDANILYITDKGIALLDDLAASGAESDL